MKKARIIEIPENKILTKDQYEDYYNHAKNSCFWYLSRGDRNSEQLKEKLYKKGYIKEDVTVLTKSGEEQQENIVNNVINYLKEISYIDDDAYAENILDHYLERGKGINAIKRILIYDKKVDSELLEELILTKKDYINSKEKELLNKKALMAVSTETFKNKDKYKQQQYLYGHLMRHGFKSEDISNWIKDNLE